MPNPPIYNKVNPADTPILTLQITLGHPAAGEGQRPGRHRPGAEAQRGDRRRPGDHRRQPEARRARSHQPDRPRRPGAQPGGRADRADAKQRQRAQRQLRRPAPILCHQRQRPDLLRRRLPRRHRRLPERRARPPARRRRRDGQRREHPPGRLGGRPARGHRGHPAPARREHHRDRQPRQGAACPGCAPSSRPR